MNKTIRVTGKGILHVKPDTTRLTIILSGKTKEYASTMELSARDTQCLREILQEQGFNKTDLKTLSFDISPCHEGYYDKNKNWKQRFIGYEYSHRCKLEFPSDHDVLGKTLYALSHSSVHPEFSISYTVHDPEAVKNELLGKAVSDAVAKARVLTAAADMTLGDILNIDYSWGKVDIEVTPLQDMKMGCCEEAEQTLDLDIEPDDAELTDTVTVVWEIK